MMPRRCVPVGAVSALCLLLAACGDEEVEAIDPREALMQFCEASDGGEPCDCGVDLMFEAFDAEALAVVATLADSASDATNPANLLQEMVRDGDLAPDAAQSIIATMTEVAQRISVECAP